MIFWVAFSEEHVLILSYIIHAYSKKYEAAYIRNEYADSLYHRLLPKLLIHSAVRKGPYIGAHDHRD